MHLLAAQPGTIDDGSEAIDLGQSPGEIVILSAADTELSCLAAAQAGLLDAHADTPSLRLANLMRLRHNLSVDVYVDRVIAGASFVLVRLLGGSAYWPYGVERLVETCRRHAIPLVLLPGDDKPDPELSEQSSLSAAEIMPLWDCLSAGGIDNARLLLERLACHLGRVRPDGTPQPLPAAGFLHPPAEAPAPEASHALIVFYRALVQAGNLAPVEALCTALQARGLTPLPVYVTSLRDPASAAFLRETLQAHGTDIVLNATAFALSTPGEAAAESPLAGPDCPVLQVIFSSDVEENWRESLNGLPARDLAMNVVLPEVDGRLLSRAVSFKAEARFDAATECPLVTYDPVPDRIGFVADLAAAWRRLRRTPAGERRVAVVLANYPNRDGRVGNGVGLDTPASVARSLAVLADAGYRLEGAPGNGDALIADLLGGPSNDLRRLGERTAGERLSFADYQLFWSALPEEVRARVIERWGVPEEDPYFRAGEVDCGHFLLPVRRYGAIAVGIQPARGYNIDPLESHHDPDLPPPHHYLAFYAWIRRDFEAHAIVHFGKHGNLEWLPGKALALSRSCFPEAVLGPLPHLYPFIVNDPGEGSQAKRRAQAVIVDHLTPPLTRAGTYGPLRELEGLVDEYYEASSLDPRRLPLLRTRILELCRDGGLEQDLGLREDEDETAALTRIDSWLCELKDLQIRDGLHIFGAAPEGALRDHLVAAIARSPRGDGSGSGAGLSQALAADLGLPANLFTEDPAEPWRGARPAALAGEGSWRSHGDTAERLEDLALALVEGTRAADPAWARTRSVLDAVRTTIAPAVAASGRAEQRALVAGLDGRFVAPGPSGAPTRGRPDVLPTGRNFYSVDTRAVPTPAAWTLGWKSAGLVIERYVQDQGDWPRAMALSCWGTANMRTGGDDIAQALALIGVRPTWDGRSHRVTGFEILPLSLLDRPRVDVTLRVSGFFRDAFPTQIDLFDSAVRAVAALDEPAERNPIAARVAEEAAELEARGETAETARERAAHRVFGSMPGAYGAGPQALIDEGVWRERGDLAAAYREWSGFAYGGGARGEARHEAFARRLARVQAVLHNQDNREHDLLDSDDYYQFEGGLAAAVEQAAGTAPTIYHNDHSRPEAPRVRALEEEIARVMRGRVVNPKWIEGVMRHGYKGAFELAATVDYLFAFAATTDAVKDHHFDLVHDAYLDDPTVRDFMAAHNPDALRELSARLIEAQDRGLWRPRRNSARGLLERLTAPGERQEETVG